MRARRTKNLLTIAASIAAYLLLSINLSWGDTTVYVYQEVTTGALTIQTIDGNGIMTPVQQTVPIPNSCFTPTLFWDSAAGALRLNGFDSVNNPSWTGTIDANGVFTTTMAPPHPLPTVDCTSAPAAASVVSAAFPDKVPCTSYSAWSTTCSGGFFTRTGQPANCVGDLTLPCPTPTLCTYTYDSAWIPATCTAGSIQVKGATGSPTGCSGTPDMTQMIRSCPPVACTTVNYACNGTCTPTTTGATTGTCPAVVSSTSPPNCTVANPLPTTACTVGLPVCTYSYACSGACQSNGTCSATATATNQPCNGTPSATTTCIYTSPPTGGATPLTINNSVPSWTVPGGGTMLFSASLPSACATTSGQLRFGVTGQQGSPKIDLLIKRTYTGNTTPPTLSDYQTYHNLTGITAGQYVDCVKVGGTTSCNSTGTFFWNFSGAGSGQTAIVYPTYTNRYIYPPIAAYATATNFQQAGLYYILAVNTTTTASLVNVEFYCY